MNMSITLMVLLSFVMVLLTMISRQHHLLPTILCLESLMLLMILYLPIISNMNNMLMSPISIVMLTMSVSSASISLTLLVMTSRKEGNDSLSSQTTNLC